MGNKHLAMIGLTLSLNAGLISESYSQVAPLDDSQLSAVWGQALLGLVNTSNATYDFTRITLNADVELNATLGQIRMGEYSVTNPDSRNGSGADIDIGLLQFGGSPQNTASLTNPYLEIAYSDGGTEVVGMRLGFEGIAGPIGVAMNSVSGALLIDLGNDVVIDSLNDPLGGRRWDGISCIETATCSVALSDIESLQAGTVAGPSRDFFISVLRQPLTFPAVNGVQSSPAAAGFWLNWRDRLSGIAPGT